MCSRFPFSFLPFPPFSATTSAPRCSHMMADDESGSLSSPLLVQLSYCTLLDHGFLPFFIFSGAKDDHLPACLLACLLAGIGESVCVPGGSGDLIFDDSLQAQDHEQEQIVSDTLLIPMPLPFILPCLASLLPCFQARVSLCVCMSDLDKSKPIPT